MMREALIDLAALDRNIATLRSAVQVPTMVIVKADAYGHGAVECGRAAVEAGSEWLGVVDIDEAMALRAAGIEAPVLTWLHDPATDFSDAVRVGIDLGVNYLAQLNRVAASSGVASVHLKVDTGLARNGAVPADWPELFDAAAAHQRAGRIIVRGLFSHLAGADDASQVALFEEALAAARSAGLDPDIIHIAASNAAITDIGSRFTLVRLGVAAYGLTPSGAVDARESGLTPVMTLSGTVVSVKRVPAGTGISYGHDTVTERETTLALVPLGYGDGIPRHSSSAGPVGINGRIHRIAGRVAMDQVVVDVGDTEVALGDRATFFGDAGPGTPSVEDWAAASSTINYEIVTRIGPRVTRRFVS